MATYDQILRGLQIIANNDPNSDDNPEAITAAHDQIWSGHWLKFDHDLPASDVAELIELGWEWDEDVIAWRFDL